MKSGVQNMPRLARVRRTAVGPAVAGAQQVACACDVKQRAAPGSGWQGVLLALGLMVLPLAAPAAGLQEGLAALWRTPDQRGSALLQQGDAAAAAQTFADPRWRAYAALRAGRYAEAAQGFSAFDDADAQYNRGNALARSGNLQGALAAYDAALKQAPQDRDIRHNRDLVREALQKPQQPQKPQQDRSAGQDGQQDRGQQGQPSQSGAGKQEGSEQKGEAGQKSATEPGQSGKQAGQQGASGSKPGQHTQNGQPGQQGGGSQGPGGQNPGAAQPPSAAQAGASRESGKDKAGQPDAAQGNKGARAGEDAAQGTAAPAGQTAAAGSAKAGGEATQARRDVQAALAQSAGGQQPAVPLAGAGADRAKSATRTGMQPPSERQMALQQWLQNIPDDPGGLLRRKFMIEHLMNQQKAQP